MATPFSWEFDAEDGVYKNHALSGKLLKHAAKKFVFVQFTQKVNDYGKKKGESVTIMHYKSLDTPANNGRLEEDVRIPVDKLQMGKTSITVSEWGRGAEYTSLSQDLSKFDPANAVQKALMDQMNHCMDNAAAQGFKDAKIVFIPTSLTGGVWDTDGTPSTTAAANMTREHVGLITD